MRFWKKVIAEAIDQFPIEYIEKDTISSKEAEIVQNVGNRLKGIVEIEEKLVKDIFDLAVKVLVAQAEEDPKAMKKYLLVVREELEKL